MTTEDYQKKVREIKNEVLNEIKSIIGTDVRHKFDFPFSIYYVGEDVVTVDTCREIKVNGDGMVCLFTEWEDFPTGEEMQEWVEGDDIYHYEPNSFFEILEHLKEDVRYKKLDTLRRLVKKAGGNINFNLEEYNVPCRPGFDCEYNGKTCYLDVLDVSRNDVGLLTVYGQLWDGVEQLNDISITEDDIKVEHLTRIIDAIEDARRKKPEERLALTDEQKEIVARIKNDLKLLSEKGGEVLLDYEFGTLFAINTKDEDFELSTLNTTFKTNVRLEELSQDGLIGGGYVCYSSEGIYIR